MIENLDEPNSSDRYRWSGQVPGSKRLPARAVTFVVVAIAFLIGAFAGRAIDPRAVERTRQHRLRPLS